jgi:predicted DNA-binding protein
MTISVTFDSKIENKITKLSKKFGSKAAFVREAVLEKIEEIEDVIDCDKRLAKKSKRWKLEELEAKLDLVY